MRPWLHMGCAFLILDTSYNTHNLYLTKTELLLSQGDDPRAAVYVSHISHLPRNSPWLHECHKLGFLKSAGRGRSLEKPKGIFCLTSLLPPAFIEERGGIFFFFCPPWGRPSPVFPRATSFSFLQKLDSSCAGPSPVWGFSLQQNFRQKRITGVETQDEPVLMLLPGKTALDKHICCSYIICWLSTHVPIC